MNKTPSKPARSSMAEDLINASSGATSCCACCLNILRNQATKGFRVAIAVQNMHYEKAARTGEISAAMLAELGVKYVIIGHLSAVSISPRLTRPST